MDLEVYNHSRQRRNASALCSAHLLCSYTIKDNVMPIFWKHFCISINVPTNMPIGNPDLDNSP